MLIRSQDKESIINFSNVISIDISGFMKTKDRYFQKYDNADVWKITYSADGTMLYLGEYTTKAKAIKVLDAIQNKYLEYYHLKGGPAILKGSIDVAENMWEVPKVFQIPTDEEVEKNE